jgi:DNA-binding SARP family transcriptional activator
MFRVRVLGALSVEDDGRPVDLPRGRPLQLIAYLALHPGPHPRRRIAEHLWPDAGPEAGRQRLRTAVWEVRRVLSATDNPLLDASRWDLGLNSAVVVDLFDARRLLDRGEGETALHLLTPGVAAELDQEWADQARREAEMLRLSAIKSAVRHAADASSALVHACRRVELEPLSEEAHRDKIRLLAASGDRAAAMVAYERMRLTLESELGIGPSAESRVLLAELASDDTPHLADVAAPRSARRRVPMASTPLVGRAKEVTELASALQKHRIVSVVGPGGVGKTRLAFTVAQQEEDRGQRIAVAELSTTRRADTSDYVLAAALAVHAGPGRAVRDAIVDQLELEPTLLVLDNCEHVLVAVRELVLDLLRWSGGTRVLVTSRQPLALPGEYTLRLLPLPVPEVGDDEQAIMLTPSVQLLCNTAQGGGFGARVGQYDVAGLARLARCLDGLPLALELAAARIPVLGVAVLTNRLAVVNGRLKMTLCGSGNIDPRGSDQSRLARLSLASSSRRWRVR